MAMVEAEKIANVLGLTQRVVSLSELTERVRHGLPKKSLRITVKHLTNDAHTIQIISNRLIPPATFKRRTTSLTAQESERVERLARVYATALDVWDDEEDARAFMLKPHPYLNNQTPLEMSYSELGARLVEQLLEKLRYGLPV